MSMNSSQILECRLHNQKLTLFCDRCLEPTCQKCTYLGPHHTAIHSLSPLGQAYERRVQEINTRLMNIAQTRQQAIDRIAVLGRQIQENKFRKQQIRIQSDLSRTQITQKLQHSYDEIRQMLNTYEEQIEQQLNNINDLCFGFQSLASDVDVLVQFDKTLEGLREIIDKIQIMLQKRIQVVQLPKQLSEIRIKLKEVEVYEDLYLRKVQTIKQILCALEVELKSIQAVKIDYEEKLKQINSLLLRYDPISGEFSKNLDKPNLRKVCYVCHFCGIFIHDQSINSQCTNNKLNSQMKGIDLYYSTYKMSQVNTSGYCKKQPDIACFGTHRHYFGEPSNPNLFFKMAYLERIFGSELNAQHPFFQSLKEEEQKILEVNVSKNPFPNPFSTFLELLFLKMKTLERIKRKSISSYFLKQQNKQGFCELITMQYILMQVIGLTPQQSEIILFITGLNEDGTGSKQDNNLRNYDKLLSQLDNIRV